MNITTSIHDILPGVQIEHFKIEKKLGEGGMASVYLATDLDLQRLVAMKFLQRRQLATRTDSKIQRDAEQRFIREACNASQLVHPNITRIYSANFQRDPWYIVMEYIDGLTLESLLQTNGPFTIQEVLKFLKQVSLGLDYAWENFRIIHRDIKPQNIMRNKNGTYKIVDFGLAKPILEEDHNFCLTTTGIPVGTPYYMSPEQAEARPHIDFRTDIFSLGATAYELITGKKAFLARSITLIYLKMVNRDYEPLLQQVEWIPPSLVELIDQMLIPDPDQRINSYSSVQHYLTLAEKELAEHQQSSSSKETRRKFPSQVIVSDSKDLLSLAQAGISSEPIQPKHPPSLSDSSRPIFKPLGIVAQESPKKPEPIVRDPHSEQASLSSTHDRRAAIQRAKGRLDRARQEKNLSSPSPSPKIDQTEMVTPTTSTRPLTEQQTERLHSIIETIKRKHNLPALDKNILELSQVTSQMNSQIKDLVKIIQRDPSLTSNVLSVVNSSLYALKNPVESISSAVVLLGFDKIRHLATRLTIFSQICQTIKDLRLYRLLTSSYFAGTFTQNLSRCIGWKSPEESFTMGLLYDLPKLILANTFPDDYALLEELTCNGVSIHEACEKVFHVPFDALCNAIYEAWRLPPSLTLFLPRENQHHPLQKITNYSALLANMMLGMSEGGEERLRELGEKIGAIIRDPSFNVKEFILQTTLKDDTIHRFFKFTPKELENMVNDVVQNVAIEKAQAKQFIVDIEQPARIISRQHRLRLEQLKYALSDLLAKHQDINQALLLAHNALGDCMMCDHILTAFLSTDHNYLIGRFYQGQEQNFNPQLFKIDVKQKRPKPIMALETKKSIRCTGATRNFTPDDPAIKLLNPQMVLITPILAEGRSIGIMMIMRSSKYADRFTDSEVAIAETVADGLTMVFEHYQEQKRRKKMGSNSSN